MISTKVIIYVFLIIFFKQEWPRWNTNTKQTKTIPPQNDGHTVVKGHVCFFTLKEVQKCLLDEEDSQRTE